MKSLKIDFRIDQDDLDIIDRLKGHFERMGIKMSRAEVIRAALRMTFSYQNSIKEIPPLTKTRRKA